jgi:hypothetical protein
MKTVGRKKEAFDFLADFFVTKNLIASISLRKHLRRFKLIFSFENFFITSKLAFLFSPSCY